MKTKAIVLKSILSVSLILGVFWVNSALSSANTYSKHTYSSTQSYYYKVVKVKVSPTITKIYRQKYYYVPVYYRDGFDNCGYNKYGFDRQGYHRDGYNQHGYDRDGYSRAGYNQHGYDRDGYNKTGYNRYGYDRDGYNKAGYNRYGYDRKGYHMNYIGYRKGIYRYW